MILKKLLLDKVISCELHLLGQECNRIWWYLSLSSDHVYCFSEYIFLSILRNFHLLAMRSLLCLLLFMSQWTDLVSLMLSQILQFQSMLFRLLICSAQVMKRRWSDVVLSQIYSLL